MTVNCRVLYLLAVLCVGQATLSAKSKPLELKWTELAPMISSHVVDLTLSDGGWVSGEAIAIREDTLVLDVKKSSGTKRYAKGNAAVPRSEIKLIALQRSRGTWGRTVGTTVGVLAGISVGADAAYHTNSTGAGVAVFAAVASGIAVVGFYAGKGLDRRTTRITIVP